MTFTTDLIVAQFSERNNKKKRQVKRSMEIVHIKNGMVIATIIFVIIIIVVKIIKTKSDITLLTHLILMSVKEEITITKLSRFQKIRAKSRCMDFYKT